MRLYLQATTLADLVDLHRPGAVSLLALDGRRSANHITNPLWPRQPPPSRAQVRLWRRYIASSFLRYLPFWKTQSLHSHEFTQVSMQRSNPEPKVSNTPSPTSFHTLKDYIKSLSWTQRRMLHTVKQKATDLQVWRAFRSKERLIIASDGGLDNQIGTFWWGIATRKIITFRMWQPS